MKKSPLDTNSPAKLKALEFARAPDNQNFAFDHDGDEQSARAFVQHMRVEFSRFRQLAISRGVRLKPIKILTREYASLPNGNTHVILHKLVGNEDKQLAVDLAALFPEAVAENGDTP